MASRAPTTRETITSYQARAIARAPFWSAVASALPVNQPLKCRAPRAPNTRAEAWRRACLVESTTAGERRFNVGEGHPATQNATASDPDGHGQARQPSKLPDGLEVAETGDHEAGGGDDVADAGDVRAALVDLGVDGVVRQRNGEDETAGT